MSVLPQDLNFTSFFAQKSISLVCAAPSGKPLNPFNSRLVEIMCFLPLWPGDIKASGWFEMFLFEIRGIDKKGTAGKVHAEYPSSRETPGNRDTNFSHFMCG